MANLKITQLPSNASPAGEDIIPHVDDPAGTPITKRFTLTAIAAFLASLTQTLTGKSIDGDDNTLTDLPAANLKIASQAQGDILYRAAAAWARLAAGTAGKVLTTGGAGADPTWETPSGGVPADGWVDVTADSWAYASATTITVPAGATAIYNKGDKIRLKQSGGTYKYWNLAAVANTLLTLIPNNDYTLANEAITANYYSKADNPLDFPAIFNFVPTYTGFSSDPSTIYYKYRVLGGFMQIFFNTGSGTSNSAAFNITLPIAPNTGSSYQIVLVALNDNGSWQNTAGVIGFNNTTTSKIGISVSTASGNAYGGFTASGSKSAQGFIAYPI